MSIISLGNFVLGGIADSKYLGIANSSAKLIGFDIHSEPGILKVNQKLKKDSGTFVDALVKVIVPCSNGETYFFSSTSGKIWRRSAAGAWSLAYTAVPAAGGAGCLGAKEYQGYIYWATESRLHRITTANALVASWTTVDLNWQTFLKTNATYHPFYEVNLVLYIGDGSYIAQVDAGTFTGDALDLENPAHQASVLGKILTDLLIGTYINPIVAENKIFRWNTWSPSFSSDDPFPEVGVNCILPTDNFVMVQAGQKGNLYLYNGSQLEQSKRIPGDWSGSNAAIVYPNAAVNRNGLPLFGLSNVSGNPAPQGIYSYGSYSQGYPKVINLEYVISTGHTSNIEIGVIALIGNDLTVAWKDGSDYGVDIIDNSNKYDGATLETRLITADRNNKKDFKATIFYRSLPTGTDIILAKSVNYAAYETVTTVKDDLRKKKYADGKILDANALQLRIKPTVSGNNAPEIESLEISFD